MTSRMVRPARVALASAFTALAFAVLAGCSFGGTDMTPAGIARVRACFENMEDINLVGDPQNKETANPTTPPRSLPQLPQLPQHEHHPLQNHGLSFLR